MSSRMKFLAVSTALVAAGGFAWLTSASAFDGGFESGPQIAQAAPPPPPSPPGAGPAAPMAAPKFNPRDMCLNRVAHRAGNRAYLKARLDLKPEQTSAWNAFEKAADEAGAKDKARCAALPTEVTTPPKFTERMTMREAWMKARLESFEAVKPSLTALYATLTPEQQALFDRPMMGGPRRHGWHGRHGRG